MPALGTGSAFVAPAKRMNLRWILVAAVCGAAASLSWASGPSLDVCLPEDALPRASRATEQGFDIDVARLLAKELDRPLRVLWLPTPNLTDIESSDTDYRPLLRGQCNLMMSVPGASDIADFGGALTLSQPYYGASWEVFPADSSFNWQQPYDGKVAVRAHTVGHRAVHELGFDWTMQPDNASIVEAVERGAASAGLVWGPSLGSLDVERKANTEPPQALRWNMHLAYRADDGAMSSVINTALSSRGVQDAIAALLKRHGIPERGPFETVHTTEALNAL
ncbi:MAG: hypothetical protein F4Y01_07840 [Gammaproteobacteria bacterium]|nr:hypothetical protein [Gammaproteobacteria bacterium]